MRTLIGLVVLAGGVFWVGSSHSASSPRMATLASIWLSPSGVGRMPDGTVYRVLTAKGTPFHFGEKVLVLIERPIARP